MKPKNGVFIFTYKLLQDLLGKFYVSCDDMISKWEEMVSTTGSCELDVWPCLDNLSSDVISRAAFGSSYEEGKKIFKLQKEQSTMAMKLIQQVYIPGLRYLHKTELELYRKSVECSFFMTFFVGFCQLRRTRG